MIFGLPQDQQKTLIKNTQLLQEAKQPILTGTNTYTNSKVSVPISSLLTTITSHVSPMSLQVARNGYGKNDQIDNNLVSNSVNFYYKFTENIRKYIPVDTIIKPGINEGSIRNEKYDPSKWNEYKSRLEKLGELVKQSNYYLEDGGFKNSVSFLKDSSAQQIVENDLLLTSLAAHVSL